MVEYEDVEVYDVMSLGKGLKLDSETQIELTRQYAERHIAAPSFCGERNVRPFHVKALATTMQRGTFRHEWVQLIVCKCNEPCADLQGAERSAGTLWRMNGQHTCHARLQLPDDYKCPVRLLKYVAKTAYDMRILYASIDRIACRGTRDVYKSYLAGEPSLSGYSVAILRSVPGGLRHFLFGLSSGRNGRSYDSDEVVYLLLTDYLELTQCVMGFLREQEHREAQWMLRAGVIAAMYATFERDTKAAHSFWTAVASGVGIQSTSDPRLKLRSFMESTSAYGRDGGKTGVDRETYYRISLLAWNAWREGRPVKLLRAPERRPPVK